MMRIARVLLKQLVAVVGDVFNSAAQSLKVSTSVMRGDRTAGGEAYLGAAAMWAWRAIKHVEAPNYYVGDFVAPDDGRRFSLRVEWAGGRTALDDLSDARQRVGDLELCVAAAESEVSSLERELESLRGDLDEQSRYIEELQDDVYYLEDQVGQYESV